MTWTYLHFETLDSTNSWVKRFLFDHVLKGFLIVTAAQQTAGRGRFGRQWISHRGDGLYVTFVRRIEGDIDLIEETQRFAHILKDFLKKHGIDAHIKWPNDLLVANKKIAGILCEQLHDSKGPVLSVGVGLNLAFSHDVQALVDQPIISMSECGRTIDKDEILNDLTESWLVTLANQE